MLEELARFDGALAARLSPGDSQRITRAIEVYRQTSRPLSEWQQDDPQGQLSGRAFNFTVLPDRDELYARINKRFAMMWEAGGSARGGAVVSARATGICACDESSWRTTNRRLSRRRGH